ncbi:MAG: HlyC/CorC family transporter [Clostridia bacterium]|nr:HlyC/CorC family transporter [Clostridia bacterium]
MPDGVAPLLITLIVLVIFSAFFSATETAYTSANRIKLRALAQNGNKKAEKVLFLAEDNYDKLISTILIGNNIVNIAAATISTLLFAIVITNPNVDSSVISTVVMTVAVLIFGEITPKFIAKTYPEKLAMAFYPLVIFFYYLLYPLNFIFGLWKWLIAKVFRLKDTSVVTEEEILTIVEEAEEDGTLKKEETNLIRSVIEFDDLEVGDILVPRVNIVAIDVNSSMEKIKKVFEKEGYSRLPVYKDSIDTILGTIHQKDFFISYLHGKKDINGILQDAYYTTEHVKISALLKQLQKKKIHIAVVLDEYGGTLGLVTLEDVLEELVGEIYDEHDEEVDYFKQLDENVFTVMGNASVVDMFKYFSLDGEEENFEATTVSGWVIEKLGEIPRSGTKFTHANLNVEVTKSTVKKVLQIKVMVEKESAKE